MVSIQCTLRTAAAMAILPCLPAAAADKGPDKGHAPLPVAAAPERMATDAVPLSAADLDTYRGGATAVTGNQTLIATTTGNVLNGSFTGGSINLSGNALTNFSGIGNFAINTGAQVSLQSGLNLIVNVTP